MRFLNARVLPGWHESRQIRRVREEGKRQLERIWKPLLGLEAKAHGFSVDVRAHEWKAVEGMSVSGSKFFGKNNGVPKDAIVNRGIG
jgi:hypothetical protein